MDGRLAPETEGAVYRIIQEALTNVAKHAKATSCRVYLQRLTNTLLVTIEDDGVGFVTADTRTADGTRGLGLVGIRERVAQLCGTVRLESCAGKGTRLTVEVPAGTRIVPEDIPGLESTHEERTLSVAPKVISG
jgi:signal transduction histidine kinase